MGAPATGYTITRAEAISERMMHESQDGDIDRVSQPAVRVPPTATTQMQYQE